MSNLILILGIIGCLFYPGYPGLALLSGFLVAATIEQSLQQRIARIAKLMLAWAIVGLGLTVTVPTIVALTREYFWITALSISVTLVLAWLLGRALKLSPTVSALIGSGTAICGASAIASVGSAVKAPAEQMSMALGVVLILNAVALTVFPLVGHQIGLSPNEFAVWAGLAIHDTSSVVAAAMAFSPSEVGLATTVKLARAIWIAPLTMLMVWLLASGTERARPKMPWFIWGYLAAALCATFVPVSPELRAGITSGSRILFAVGLFLTGSATNVRSLVRLGAPPLLLGMGLWLASAAVTLGWIFIMR